MFCEMDNDINLQFHQYKIGPLIQAIEVDWCKIQIDENRIDLPETEIVNICGGGITRMLRFFLHFILIL